MKLIKSIFLATALATLASIAHADTLWTNPITGTNPSSTNPFTSGQTVISNITVTGIGFGAGAAANAANDRYNLSSWNTTSMDTSAYFTFTLDANTGFQINFTSFVYTGQASGSFTSPQLSLRSSLDSFATSIGTATTTGTTISLSAAAYQGLTNPIEFRLYVWNGPTAAATYSINDFTFNGTVTAAAAAGNNSTITASPSSVSMGRVIQNSTANSIDNVTVSKTGSSTTTWSASADGNTVVSGATGSFATGSVSDGIAVDVKRTSTGIVSGTVTIDNTAADSAAAGQGSLDANDAIAVTGTVVANRDIAQTGGAINLGKVLVGTATATATGTLTGGAQDDNNGTRVNIVSGTVSAGGVGISYTSGGDNLFDSANETKTVSVNGNFATSGSKSSSVNAAGLLSNGEAAGVGATVDASVNVAYTADVYQAASLTTNTSSPLDNGDSVTVNNAATTDGGQRAAAEVVSKIVTGDGWTVSGLDENTTINQNTTASASVSFNEGGKLNGTHTGTLLLSFEHADQTIRGTSANDLGARSWSFSHVVSGVTASSGEATVQGGGSYSGFGLTNSSGKGTVVSMLAGISSGNNNLSLSFDPTAPGFGTATNDANRVSDIVSLSGSGTDVVVLQLTYDEAAIVAAGYTSENELKLGYYEGGVWVVATNANTGNNALLAQKGFLGSFDSFQSLYGADVTGYIGAYGVDATNNTVWAVIDHNSDFAVVPEPGTYALLALGGTVLFVFRRRMTARRA